MSTPYEVLRIQPGVSADEIKAAYRRACMRAHPDRGGSEEQFRAVQKAYEDLQKGPCPECGGEGFIVTRRGFFIDKTECPQCWNRDTQ